VESPEGAMHMGAVLGMITDMEKVILLLGGEYNGRGVAYWLGCPAVHWF